MINVLHFYKTSLRDTAGGVENVIDHICRGVVEHGIHSTVFSLSENQVEYGLENFNGYKTIRTRRNFKFFSTDISFSAIRHFSKLAKSADLIHYHFPWPLADVAHFLSGHNKPTIVTYHSDIVKQKILLPLYTPLMNSFLQSVDSIVATSKLYLDSSVTLQKFSYKTSVIPIGIEKNFYPKVTPSCRDYWKSKLGAGFFLFIGALRYYKGVHNLLEANRRDDFPLIIVGFGPEELRLKKMVHKFGLKNTTFVGQVTEQDKVALIQLSLCIILPSHLRSEAFGVALVEAAMFGRPMISCELGTGTSFVNKDGETGLVVEPNNPEKMSMAMRTLYHSEDMVKGMGVLAKERFQRLFTAKKMAAGYAQKYDEIMSNCRK